MLQRKWDSCWRSGKGHKEVKNDSTSMPVSVRVLSFRVPNQQQQEFSRLVASFDQSSARIITFLYSKVL